MNLAAVRLLGCLTVLLAVAAPAPAAADTDHRLGLSWDGATWTAQLDGALFDRPGSIRHWVPGDQDVQRFYVRNRSHVEAALSIQALLHASQLYAPRNIVLAVRVGRGGWQRLPEDVGWTTIDSTALSSGRVTAVAVRGVFDWSSPNASQELRFPVDFRVRLAQRTTSHGSAPPPGSSSLPSTGSPVPLWIVAVAVICLAGGLALVVLARRKDRSDG